MEENYDRIEEVDEITGVSLIFRKYFLGNLLHRLDGPAAVFMDMIPRTSRLHRDYWFYRGKHIKCDTQEEFESIIALRAFW